MNSYEQLKGGVLIIYKENPIFYFTGTGGSLWAARRITEALPEFAPVPVAALRGEAEVAVDSDAVGLVFPLYYAGLPNIMEAFVRKLKFSRPAYIFAVVPCGVPWSGYALHQLRWLLKKRGQKLSSGYYLKMTDNFLPHYDMPKREAQAVLDAAADAKLTAIIESLKRRESKIEREKALLLYPSHPIYMPRLKRFDRFFTVDDTCTACGTCQTVCPVDNVALSGGKPEWKHNCEFCLACIQYCPVKAIQWKKITQTKGRYHYMGISARDVAGQKTLGD